MEVIKLNETGFNEAALGLSLSFRHITDKDIEDIRQGNYGVTERIRDIVMPNLAPKGNGHNKFLESIQVWLLVRANRAFWAQFDTYRCGISKQSESTMHTLAKRKPTIGDFDTGTDITLINNFIDSWHELREDIDGLRRSLPQGWLESRQICTNYKTLQNMYYQRKDHRSKDWRDFLRLVLSQLEHPKLITGPSN